MAKVLVIGGAGYVGSSMVAHLLDHGHEPWVLDDLSTGHSQAILVPQDRFIHAQAGDVAVVEKLLDEQRFDCVMHFAARSIVSESVLKPDEYFENNVLQTQRLIETLLASAQKTGWAGHRRFIFSSTCAIYGDPGVECIDESCAKNPINPYGESKLAAEKMMEGFARDQGLQVAALRYFNASGADPKGRVGEWHHPETHLIPNILGACVRGGEVSLFGTDYPTEDGSCVRDYIHVDDLARAHVAAMDRLIALKGPLAERGRFEAFNLGSENGFSVREVIEGCMLITGKKVRVLEKPRRPGDPPLLVADSQLAQKVLGFATQYSLEDIIQSAYQWEEKRASTPVRAIFLDRDGTLNFDPGYLSDPDQLSLLPQVGEALGALKRAGFMLIVVSNQSGVNRGFIQLEMLPKIHEKLNGFLRPAGGTIDEFIYCVHRPEEKCDCRKPSPGMLLDAKSRLCVDLSNSYMIGDKLTDVQVGNNARVKASILLRTGDGKKTEQELLNSPDKAQATFIADSLLEAANWILARET
jgi:UDP-glucose 4-epimerase